MACGSSMEWSSLPTDLLLAVFAILPSDADRVRFRAVCARWSAAAEAWRPPPWLVGSRTDRSGQGAAMSSFWLSHAGGLVPFAAAVPPGLECLSSSHGYLALSDPRASPKAITFVNPVTGRRIPLPPIGFFKKWHDVATVVLSADPGTASEWAAVAAGFPANCLAYYSSATGAWTPLDFSAAGYAGIDTLFINAVAETKASTFHFHLPPTTAHPAMAATSLSLALSPLLRPTPRPQPHPRPVSPKFPKPLRLVLTAVAPFSDAPLAAVPDGVAVADVVEKDWSFLDAACSHLPRALAAGALSPASRVLAVTPTASFVGALLSETPCELLVAAHESLYVLAGIKEEHDEVRCFHLEGGGGGRGGGVVEAVPERFDAFDAVFVCYFPGMGVSAAALLKSLAKRCSKGGRVVIFLDQGRQNLEQHCREHGDVVTTDLPSRSSLEKAAAGSKYEIAEFVDEPTLYLAVLQFQG